MENKEYVQLLVKKWFVHEMIEKSSFDRLLWGKLVTI